MQKSRFSSLLIPLLLSTACNNDSSPPQTIQQTETPVAKVALKQAANCEDLKQKFVDNWVENLLDNQRFIDVINVSSDGLITNESAGDASTGIPVSAPDDVSQTNVQEAGVDEADRVKADSQGNLYIAQHDKLIIADAFPPQSMSIQSTLPLAGLVSGIYLSEADQVIAALVTPVIDVITPSSTANVIAPYIPWHQKTDLVLVDVSDAAKPVIGKRIRLDGQLISSRRVDSKIIMVQSYYLNSLINTQNPSIQRRLNDYRQAFLDDNASQMEGLQAAIRRLVANGLDFKQVRDLLPRWQVLIDNAEQSSGLLACEDVFMPDIDLNHNQLLTVTSIDLASDAIQRIAAIGSGWITYASQNDLFIVQPGHHWWWDRDQHQQSAIHHFSIGGVNPAYVSTGLIKGYINNSFSLSYYQDHLRVATTQNLWNRRDLSDIRSTNHLFILADNTAQSMDIIGSVQNYADNERIFAARFLGEKGFVVTFRQIDPLFSFDLSDAANPFIAGELKIPGFSSYMHPIEDSHLLTIGRDGTDTGVTDQVAIKLFDISDLAAPLEVDSYTPVLPGGYSWSPADWDHHAFTYYQPTQMLAVPVSSYNPLDDDFFMGIMVLNVDLQTGLSLAGEVDHEDLLIQATCESAEPNCHSFYYRWLSQPTRSVFMTESTDSYLYSLSNIGLKSVNTSTLDQTVGSLLLPSPKDFYEVYLP